MAVMQGVVAYMALLAFMLLGGILFWFGYPSCSRLTYRDGSCS